MGFLFNVTNWWKCKDMFMRIRYPDGLNQWIDSNKMSDPWNNMGVLRVSPDNQLDMQDWMWEQSGAELNKA